MDRALAAERSRREAGGEAAEAAHLPEVQERLVGHASEQVTRLPELLQ